MADISEEFKSRIEELQSAKEVYILSCSAPEYSDYSKGCGYLDGLTAALAAFDEAEAASS